MAQKRCNVKSHSKQESTAIASGPRFIYKHLNFYVVADKYCSNRCHETPHRRQI